MFLVILATPIILSQLSFFSIRDILLEGNNEVLGDEMVAYTKEHISGNYFKLFSKSNIFLYSKKAIENGLLKDFSRLETASISFVNLHSINIKVSLREPFAVWCKSTNSEETHKITPTNDCYFIDKGGFIFSSAPNFSGDVYIKYYGRVFSEKPIGEYFYKDKELFNRIHAFILEIQKLGFSLEGVFVYDDGDVELHTKRGGVIYITTRDDLSVVFSNLASILNDKTTSSDPRKFIDNFKYIDLRFGKKIFLKF